MPAPQPAHVAKPLEEHKESPKPTMPGGYAVIPSAEKSPVDEARSLVECAIAELDYSNVDQAVNLIKSSIALLQKE